MTKTVYHVFKRQDPRYPDDPPVIVRARVIRATSQVVIRLTKTIVEEAIKRDGQADTQNCAGAICVIKHKKLFAHPVTSWVDWYPYRVYIKHPTNESTGKTDCHVYAHKDQTDELMDTDAGLRKLLKKFDKREYIDIILHPVKKDTRKRTKSYSGPSGKRRPIGAELRYLNHISGRFAPKTEA